ncbi:hypothetical protein A4X13_0g4343 [Tilletia indica]|uniref:Uncharacterized protein n=1 Tax=Tilletia indica TaxID=43049 RepID=A0A177TD58_9BASI|nr:hypothetical protein A4X13_0g4343 [Tilletia indica]
MPPLLDKTGDRIRSRIASIEVWRDGVHRACRRRILAQYVSRASEEDHPAWSCSLIEFTFKERVAEFFEWMNEKRWKEDWTAEKKDPLQALIYLDYAVKNGRDDLPTAHERMKEHLAAGKGKMPGPTWAPFPFGSPRHPEGYEPDCVGVVSPEPVATPSSIRDDASEDDWAQQSAAMALQRAPAQAETPGLVYGQDMTTMELYVPHPGGSWIRDWRRSEAAATINHVPSEPPYSGPSTDSVSTPGIRQRRLRVATPSNAASSTRRWVEGDAVFPTEEHTEDDSDDDGNGAEARAAIVGVLDNRETQLRIGMGGDAEEAEQERAAEVIEKGKVSEDDADADGQEDVLDSREAHLHMGMSRDAEVEQERAAGVNTEGDMSGNDADADGQQDGRRDVESEGMGHDVVEEERHAKRCRTS